MVYNNSQAVTLSKEEVLNMINELEVYTFYMGFKPEINQIYISPLRHDKSPSFNLFWGKNGHLLYKDFGTGNSGDCITFVKELTNTTTSKAISEILELFTSKKINNPPKKRKLRKIPTSTTSIDIKILPYNEEGLEFWNKFGIDLKTLNKYEVFQVKSVWINDNLKLTYKKGNPIFAYKLYDRIKIYQPLDREHRFFTNCNVYYIQGWKQLDRNKDTLIITKSLKDVMLLNILGYAAIAPNAESYAIPDNIVTEIKKNFNNIILLYDRDIAGILNTRKIVKNNKFDFRFIPKKYKCKDITDFYLKYGKDQTIKVLSNLI